MPDAVLDALTEALTAAGVRAVRAYPDTVLSRGEGPVVCVGMKANQLVSAGAGDYLGQETVNGVLAEVYGFRMDLTVSLDIYAPDDGRGAAACGLCAEAVCGAFSRFPSGLKPRALECGETAFDAETGMFRLPMSLRCAAFLLREKNSETGEFTDFALKGVVR